MPPAILALVLVLGLLALLPTRRLFLAGWSSGALATYFGALWVFSFLVALVPGPGRILVPILVVAWLLPFVSLRAGFDRLFRRSAPGRPPMRNVTPRPVSLPPRGSDPDRSDDP